MMFDTLVCAPSEDQAEFDEGFEIFRGSKALCDEVLRKTSYFDSYKSGQGGARDPILQYLQRYYSPSEQLDSSDVGDLSWDEGDLPHHHIKVWTFNDFMGQYNQLYAFLNNIQVQYHTDKRSPHSTSPRVDGLLRDLERDVERREHFLRECGRMVGAFPELEEEVGWRVEHVIAKWEMLGQLRGKGRGAEAAADIYSDIELEVRCLRRWLREMEARIDPLQFGGVEGWSAGDRERKMAEYQVLQMDIESHGRVVKLVLGLCEELGQDPGLYDLQHAVKVARGLERRWHHIWLRSLEWQCLLEQWIHRPARGEQAEDSVFDTDDEPLTKVPRLTSDLGSCTASPAATLLRRKRRKRWPGTPREEHGGALLSPEVQGGGEVPEEGVKMQTSESDPSTAPSTARSESSESTFGFQGGAVEGVERGEEQREEAKDTPLTPLSILQVLEDIIDVDENSHDGFWDTSDEDAFLENKNKLMQKVRKVTVVHQPPFALETRKSEEKENTAEDQNVMGKRWDRREEVWKKSVWESDGEEWSELEGRRRSEEVEGRKRSEESMFSQDSLEVPEVPGRPRGLVWTEGSSGEEDTCSSETDKDQASAPEQLLSFGDDYRRFLESLSDSSVQRARPSRRLKKRSTKRREGGEGPYDSNSEGEVELEAACATLAASLAAVTKVEQQAAAFFTLPEAARDPADYDAILRSCSEQVNLLFHLLAAVGRRQGFPQQKRARDIRLLIGRWEGLLQTVSETVHNSTVYHGLRRQRDEVREALVRLESAALGEGEELDVRLAAIKVTIEPSFLPSILPFQPCCIFNDLLIFSLTQYFTIF